MNDNVIPFNAPKHDTAPPFTPRHRVVFTEQDLEAMNTSHEHVKTRIESALCDALEMAPAIEERMTSDEDYGEVVTLLCVVQVAMLKWLFMQESIPREFKLQIFQSSNSSATKVAKDAFTTGLWTEFDED